MAEAIGKLFRSRIVERKIPDKKESSILSIILFLFLVMARNFWRELSIYYSCERRRLADLRPCHRIAAVVY